MISKDTKIGNTEGVVMVEMGTGDIAVVNAHSPEGGYSAVMFREYEPKEIGESSGIPGGITSDEFEPEVALHFTDVRSIDVVIKHLEAAKIKLRNIQ